LPIKLHCQIAVWFVKRRFAKDGRDGYNIGIAEVPLVSSNEKLFLMFRQVKTGVKFFLREAGFFKLKAKCLNTLKKNLKKIT
jgi:hypothetical protein